MKKRFIYTIVATLFLSTFVSAQFRIKIPKIEIPKVETPTTQEPTKTELEPSDHDQCAKFNVSGK